MPNVLDVNLDSVEMIVRVDKGKRTATEHIAYHNIHKICIAEESEKRWLSTRKFKAIKIFVRGYEEPLVIRSDKLKHEFQSTEIYFRSLAQRRGVPLEVAE